MDKLLLDPHSRKLEDIFPPEDLERLGDLVELLWGSNDPMPEEEARAAKREAAFIVTGRWRYGGVDEEEAPLLRAVMEVSGSHPPPRELDYETCFRRSIRVLSCAPAFAPYVAELALGLAIAAGRDIVNADREMRTVGPLPASQRASGRRWAYSDVSPLYGQPVGIIGYGNLGRALRPLLTPFGSSVGVYDPWLPASALQRQGLAPVSLEQLLKTSRFIFVTAAPSAENRALLSRSMLERIARDAVLVLVSRAHLVDFDALVELADAGRFTAAIDVYPEEPLPDDHPARRAKNVILTPHLAGAPGRRDIGGLVTDDVEAMVRGLPPMRMQPAQPEIIRRRG